MGLLSEATPDVDIADPFFAYCKQHCNRSTSRVKKRNYQALVANLKTKDSDVGEKYQVSGTHVIRSVLPKCHGILTQLC